MTVARVMSVLSYFSILYNVAFCFDSIHVCIMHFYLQVKIRLRLPRDIQRYMQRRDSPGRRRPRFSLDARHVRGFPVAVIITRGASCRARHRRGA